MELDQNKFFASGDLEGKVFDGWTVVSKLASPDRSKHETGGNFSTCYKVEKNGETAFMKVMDYAKIIMMIRGGLTAEIMKRA